MKVTTIVGARPQFIKAATVCRAFAQMAGVEHRLIHSGQHYDDSMSGVFFRELDLPPVDRHLGIGSGSHGVQTGRMMEAIEKVLLEDRPDAVLVYGDTNTTLAGALAAVKLHIPVGHVEAGLRSYNRRMPEEINRIATDHVSDLLFAPTRTAVDCLRKEGIPDLRIAEVGDVMYDAALYYAGKADRESRILETLSLEPRSYLLATVHRAENTDDPDRLATILEGLGRASERLPVVLPLHPRTRDSVRRFGLTGATGRIRAIDPVGYLDMTALERNARAIATDSGGVQKEAFLHRVPCVTLREETEWVETVEQGANRLVGADANRLTAALDSILRETRPCPDPGASYGDGHAADRIARRLAESVPLATR